MVATQSSQFPSLPLFRHCCFLPPPPSSPPASRAPPPPSHPALRCRSRVPHVAAVPGSDCSVNRSSKKRIFSSHLRQQIDRPTRLGSDRCGPTRRSCRIGRWAPCCTPPCRTGRGSASSIVQAAWYPGTA
uniref:Uncharacterized protein n=1 Tax=Arundo donax TaxID=35708 RepID=A0A0A9ENN8_ARUDO